MSNYEADSERPSKRPKVSSTSQNEKLGPFNLVLDDREVEVGITEFVSQDVAPFQAILKKRYTDFMVNEILPGGEVIHLTDTFVPKQLLYSDSSKEKTSEGPRNTNGTSDDVSKDGTSVVIGERPHSEQINKVGDESNQDPAEPLQPGEIADKDKEELVSLLNENAVDELLQLYQSILKHPTLKRKDHPTVRTEFTSDRALRAQIHGIIRRVFSSKVDSATDNDGFLCLTAANPSDKRSNNKSNGDGAHRHYPGKLGWIERGGEYLHFTLYKENKDTMEVISFLTRQLKTNAKMFQFAGTKDRRAITAQRVSAHRLDAERLAKQNHHLRNAAVGNFEYRPSGLELGELGGNEFMLTLRDCQFTGLSELHIENALPKVQSALNIALSNMHTKGFLNYFGLQRFGTFATRTDTVGLHILKNDFRSACEAILQYDPAILASAEEVNGSEASTPNQNAPSGGRDDINRAKAIQLFQKTSHAHKSLEILPRKFSAENQLIRHLARSPTDYIGALLAIPRNLRLMYVHAYQSIVWNKAASRRWQLYGSTVVEGDLVLIKEHETKGPNPAATAPEDPSTNVDADGEIIIAPSSHDRSAQIDDIFERARALTPAEAASGQYSIFDVVLPLPGFDVTYPANASGQFYKDYMASTEGGCLDPYDMRRKQKDFSLSGGYRKIIARIGEVFDVQVHLYKRDEEQFIQTDFEKLNKAAGGTDAAGKDDAKMQGIVTNQQQQPDVNTSGDTAAVAHETVPDKIAAVLKFQLGASQYATMALRELSRGGVTAYKPEFNSGRGG